MTLDPQQPVQPISPDVHQLDAAIAPSTGMAHDGLRSNEGVTFPEIAARIQGHLNGGDIAKALELGTGYCAAVSAAVEAGEAEKIQLAEANRLLGQVYISAKDYASGIRHFERAIAITDGDSLSDRSGRCYYYCLISGAKLQTQDLAAAEFAYQEAMNQFTSITEIPERYAQRLAQLLQSRIEATPNSDTSGPGIGSIDIPPAIQTLLTIPSLPAAETLQLRLSAANICERSGDMAGAETHLRAALPIRSGGDIEHYHAAMVRYALAQHVNNDPLSELTPEGLCSECAQLMRNTPFRSGAAIAISALRTAAEFAIQDGAEVRASRYLMLGLAVATRFEGEKELFLSALEGVAKMGLWVGTIGNPEPLLAQAEQFAATLYGPFDERTTTWFERRADFIADNDPTTAMRLLAKRLQALPEQHPERILRLLDLAALVEILGQPEKTAGYIEKAIQEGKALPGEHHILLARAYDRAGQSASSQGKEAEAREYFDLALQTARNLGHTVVIADQLCRLAEFHMTNDDFVEAGACFSEVLTLFPEDWVKTHYAHDPETGKRLRATHLVVARIGLIEVHLESEDPASAIKEWKPAHDLAQAELANDLEVTQKLDILRALIAVEQAFRNPDAKHLKFAWHFTDVCVPFADSAFQWNGDALEDLLTRAVALAERQDTDSARVERYQSKLTALEQRGSGDDFETLE